MTDKKPRDANYWGSRLREDKTRLDKATKLNLIRGYLLYTTPLEKEEVDLFLAPSDEISDPEALMQYSITEGKIAEIFSSEFEADWIRKQQYLDFFRDCLGRFYTPSELDEIVSHIHSARDANALTVWLAGDHYAWRRIRNAYLPEITELVSIDTETGQGEDLTGILFAEGPEDSVSRIERLLGRRKKD
jgi:hypothetical protein